eukprot:5676307-Prymnesium_polylepis.1
MVSGRESARCVSCAFGAVRNVTSYELVRRPSRTCEHAGLPRCAHTSRTRAMFVCRVLVAR